MSVENGTPDDAAEGKSPTARRFDSGNTDRLRQDADADGLLGEEVPPQPGFGSALDAPQPESEASPGGIVDEVNALGTADELTSVTELEEAKRKVTQELAAAREELRQIQDEVGEASVLQGLRKLVGALGKLREELEKAGAEAEETYEKLDPVELRKKTTRDKYKRLVTDPDYEKANQVTSYIAVLLSPALEVINGIQQLLTGSYINFIPVHIITMVTTDVFFAIDTYVNRKADPENYNLKNASLLINVVTILADMIQLFLSFSFANPRFLKVVKIAKVGKAAGMAHKSQGVRSDVLEQECHRYISDTFAKTLLFMVPFILYLAAKEIVLGKTNSLEASSREFILYMALIMAVRFFSKSTREAINSTYSKRFSEATGEVIKALKEVPGFEDADEVIMGRMEEYEGEKLAQRKHGEKVPDAAIQMNEIQIMSEVLKMIIGGLNEMISHAGFRSVVQGMDAETVARAYLFSDIRGFSTHTEKLGEDVFEQLLDPYFDQNLRVVLQEGGDVDKLIGDAIFGTFESADEAFDAVIKMHRLEMAAESALKVFYDDEEHQVGTRFGLHWGISRRGAIGAKGIRREITHLGEDVNIAARMEPLCNIYGVSILISEQTYEELSAENQAMCRMVDRISVKGMDKPICIYTVDLNEENDNATFMSEFERGRNLYLKGRWEEAEEALHKALEQCPADGPTKTLIKRIKESKETDERDIMRLANRYPRAITSKMRERVFSAIGASDFVHSANFVEPKEVGGLGHWRMDTKG